ncbi:MAG: amino acid adenylation domain-containing protein [Deltaproteobacteria bacterium]|nr:amino acid adenylation domain-containing protein [Deltaproteobacteria bacterium]
MADSEIQADAEAVAIVGMAGRFPGANRIDEFWRNLQSGVESIRFFSDAELAAAGVDAGTIGNEAYVRARGILSEPGPEWFDAAFFGIQPKEAEVMDPQQRIFLETAWEALESAGCDPEKHSGVVGVFGGMTKSSYFLNYLFGRADVAAQAGDGLIFLGNDKDYLTTRVSYKLNLKGPSVNVSNACSTSLVAVCQAWQSLLNYQCDVALAGGVSISVPQERGYFYQEGNIASPDGHCRSFDANAQGTLFSNGVGIVVLKRLSEALAAGDHIWAVIKGAAVNNDGSAKVSFAAPSVDGQAEVISLAQAVAGVDAATISYVEAHGTATPLGDPIEIAALTQAFRASTEATNFCAIGSVKTNLGHLDVAAGVAGLIKTSLALWHKQLPPSLHFEKPNPKIDFANSPFYVNTKLKPWTQGSTLRRAGVSSFGTGSTNAHVVLEEAPERGVAAPARAPQLLVLSARSEAALAQASINLATRLEQNPDLNLADVAHTLQTGRRDFAHRRAVVCRDRSEAITVLTTADPKGKPLSETSGVAFMFPGQGAQYVNMARGLYDEKGLFYTELSACAEFLTPRLGLDIREVLYPDSTDDEKSHPDINATLITQPVLFAVGYALAQQWLRWGVRPRALIGHSLGEYVAACLAGVMSRDDALMLLAERARLMQALPCGVMLAVRLAEDKLAPRLGAALSIAAINSPKLTMVAGPHEAIEALEAQLGEEKVVCKRLGTSHAFHSAMLDPILAPFGEIVRRVKFDAPQIPWVSSLTGDWIANDRPIAADYWVRQMRQAVRFSDALRTLLSALPTHLLEVGPGRALGTFARQQAERETQIEFLTSLAGDGASERDLDALLQALGRLWCAGAAVDWQEVHDHRPRRKVPLPTYPFERKRYWVDAPPTVAKLNEASKPAMNPIVKQSSKPAAVDGAAHRARILGELQALFSEISGIPLADFAPTVAFLELGLDSLILTQASTAIHKRFAINIKFRQLLEEYDSLNSLADHLVTLIPPPPVSVVENSEAATDHDVESQVCQPIGDQNTVGNLAIHGVTDHDALERIFARQLDLMQQQLDMLRGAAAVSTTVKAQNTQPVVIAAAPTTPAIKPETITSETRGFGPYKPVNKGSSGGLSARQVEALKELSASYLAKTRKSKELTAEYRSYLADPRAVSGFRAWWKELVYPIVTERSAGAKLWDVDGNEYIDLTSGFGAIFFGHAPAFVTEALHKQLEQGMEIGPQSPLAGKVAKLLCELTGMERAAFCNTGSEAVLAAMRMARTVTGRDKIATFSGDYHGIFDEVVVRGVNRSGELKSIPAAPGIPASATQNMLVLDHEDPRCLEILRAHAHELAAVIVEPVQGRRVDFQPKELFQQIREFTEESGSALIFDEVITGFRTHLGGMQAVYGIRADIATYGKVIGGGFPIGVVAGNAQYMDALDGGPWQYGDDSAPEVGMTYFAGTFVRHPLALAAAWACLNYLKEQGPQLQETVNQRTERLVNALRAEAETARVPVRIPHFSSVFAVEFPPDCTHAGLFYVHMRDRGIHVWEGRSWILTAAHSDADVERIVAAFRDSLAAMQAAGFLPTSSSGTPPLKATLDGGSKTPAQFSMTEGQRELWLAAQLSDEASLAFADTALLRLRGGLDCQALVKAINEIVARHDALRAVFDAEGREVTTRSKVDIAVPLEDLSHLDQTLQAEQLRKLAEADNRERFALDGGPLLRARIVKCAPEDHKLVLTTHHIAVDGWSHGVLFAELGALYSAFCNGETPSLATATQFGDYASWQERQRQEGKSSEAEAYWLAQYEQPVPLLDLPTDRPRPATRSYSGAQECLKLPEQLADRLRRFMAERRATLFATGLAAFNVLLHRLSGQQEFAVAISAAGQISYGSPDLVGHCVNFLPLRTRLTAETKFVDYLTALRTAVLDAFEHQNCTYGSLLQKLKLPRDASRAPLVAVSSNVDKVEYKGSFRGLDVSQDSVPRAGVSLDSEFNVIDTGSDITLQWQFNSAIFDAATIRRWLGHYQTLIEAVATDGGKELGQLPMLSAPEREQLLHIWNDNRIEYPKDQLIHELFEIQAEGRPDAVALIYEAERVSYRNLNERANQLAHHLRTLGIGSGGMVAVCLNRSVEMVAALLAILKAGGAYVPLDPKYPRERLNFMLRDSGASVLVTQSELIGQFAESSVRKICVDSDGQRTESDSNENLSRSGGSNDLAYLIYTSGSTGQPKGVAIEHRSAVAFIHWAKSVFGAEELRGVLAATSICFDLSIFELFVTLGSGGAVILAQDALQLPNLPAAGEVTLVNTVPSAMAELVRGGQIPVSVRTVNLAGEPLKTELVDRIYESTSVERVYDLYGPTEDTTYSTFTLRQRGAAPSIGRPIHNTQAYILDRWLNPVPIGVAGELYLGGEGLAQGYHNRPELTAEKFVTNPFSADSQRRLYRTGDLARYRPDGQIDYLGESIIRSSCVVFALSWAKSKRH